MRRVVPSNAPQTSGKRKGHIIPPFTISAAVLEERPVSSGNVQKLEEHLFVVRRWELQETAKIWERSNLAKGSTSQSKDMVPTCKQVATLIENELKQKGQHLSLIQFPAPITIGSAETTGKKRESKIMHRMGHHIYHDNFSWSKILHPATQRRESKRARSEEPNETENSGKGRLDPPSGEKAVRRGSGRQTLTLLA